MGRRVGDFLAEGPNWYNSREFNAPDAAARCPGAFWQNEAKPKSSANSVLRDSDRCPRLGRSLQLHSLVHQALQHRVVDLAGGRRGASRQSAPRPAARRHFQKYNRFTMENRRQLQCNALRGREKSRRRRNNGYQWKNNAKNNGNNEKYNGDDYVRLSRRKAGNGAARARCRTNRVRL
jgi:hypothetical protein